MHLGILGSGDVGQALGRGLIAHDHEVMIGSRSPDSDKLADWKDATGGKGQTGTFEQTAKFGQTIIVACLGSAAVDVVRAAGTSNFANKLVLDATNPLKAGAAGAPGLFVGLDDSLGEQLQRELADAHVVKCFNTVPNSQMINPKVGGGRSTMMICGSNSGAKEQTTTLLKELGWDGVLDLGDIDAARWMEAFVPLWVRVGMALGTWDHLFGPLERP